MQKEIKSAQHCSHYIITYNLLQIHADSQQFGGMQAYLTTIYHHPSLQYQTYEEQKSFSVEQLPHLHSQSIKYILQVAKPRYASTDGKRVVKDYFRGKWTIKKQITFRIQPKLHYHTASERKQNLQVEAIPALSFESQPLRSLCVGATSQ